MSDEQHKNRKRNCEGNAQFSDTREYSSSDDDDGPIVRQMKKRPKVYSSSSYGSDSSEEEIRANPNGNRVLRFHSSRSNSSSSSDDSSSSSSAFSPTHRPNRATARLRSTSNSSCSPNEQNHIESSSDSNDTSADKCPICLARFRGQEIGCPDSCDHLFCASCITEWGKNVNTCPVDRSQFGAVLVRAHIHSSHVTRSIPIVVAQQERDEQQQDDNTVCEVCGRADREETLLLCDGCDRGWHMECLRPPLVAVPEGLWYCELCARDVLEARIAIESRNRAIPRTRLIERVRTRVMNQNRRNNNNNTQSTAAVANTAGPSTSTGRRSVGTTTLINVRTMTTTRSIKRRKVRRRRRKRRPPLNGQQVHINYELDENNGQKLAIRTRICTKSKSRRRRRHKNSRKSPKPCSKAQRERRRHREVFGYRSKKKLSVKERLAQQLGMCRTQTWYNLLPDVNGRPPGGGGGSTGHVATVAGSSRTSIIPQLHLFGHRDTLEYFSDSSDGVNDDDSLGGCGGLVTARTAAASTEAALLRRTARTKAAVLPLGNRSNNSQESRATQTTATSISQPPAAGTETAILTTTTAPAAVDTISGDTSSTMDILSTILESQLQFHARHSTLTLNRDGSIQIASRALAQMRHARYAAHNTPITSTSTAPLQTTSLPNNTPTTSKSLVVSADSNIVHSPSNIAQDQLFGVSTTTTITPTLAPVVVKTAAATGGYNQGQGTSGGFGGSSGGTNADRSTGGNNNNNRDCVSTSTGGAGGGSSGAGGSGSGGGGGDGGQHGNQYIDASDLYDPEEDTQDDEADEQQLTRDSHQEQPTDYSMAAIQQKDDDEDIYSDIETTVSTSQQQQQSNIGNDDDNRETIENENAIQSQQLTAPLTVDNLVDYDDDDDDDDDNVDLVIDDSKPQDRQQEETSLVSSSTSNNNNMVDNMAATMERMEQHVKAMLMLVDGNEDSVNFQPDGAQDGGGGLAETPHSTCDDDNNKMAEDQRDEDDSDDDGCPNFNIYSSESVSMATNMADQPEKCPDQRPVEANIDVSLPNTQEEEEQLMLNDGSTELISTSDENSPNRTIPTADQQPKKLTNNNLYSDSDEEIEIKIDQPADQLDQLTDNELITDIRQMTEDISEDEDVSEPETEQQPAERSFTPCLDENNMAVPKASCEDLEAISDEENRNDFSADGQQGHLIVELEINAKESELDFSGTKTIEDETEEEAHIEKTRKEQSVNNEAVSAGDKQLKAKEANKTKKTDANKSIEPSFKKLSKNNKDRNYRNDKEDSNKKRIRDKSRENSRDNDRRRDKDKENRRDERRRNKEKRKEIQRYSVRSLIADKPTVRKDRFGRDEEFRKTKSRSRSKEKQKRDKRLSSTSSASPIAQRHNRRQRSGSTPASQFRRSTNRRSLRSISRSRCSTSGNRGYNQQQQQQQQRSSSHDSTSPTFRDQQQQYILGRMIYDQQQQQQQSRYQRFNRSRSYTPAMMPDCIDQGVVVVAAAPPPPPPSSADRKKRKGKGAEKRVQSRSRSGPRGGAKKRKKDRADGAGRGKRGKQQRERSRRRERDRDRLNKRQRVDNRDQVHSSPPLHQHPHHISPSQLTITHQQPLTPPLQQRGSGGGGDYTPPPLRQLYEPRPSRHLTPAPLNSAAASWTPPRATTNQQSNPTDGVQSESLTVILTNDRNKRKEKRNKKDKRVSRRGRRDRTPPPSKEVFASGDNILVSVSFNKETANATSAAAPTGEPCATLGTTAAAAVTAALNSISGRNKRKRAATPPPQQQQLQQQRRQRQRHLSQFQLQKPVAIIDLDRSPFHELTPSPRDVIVLSDDDEINVERDVELVRRMVALDEETDDDDDDDDGDGGGDDDMEDGEVRNSRRPAVAMCEHHQQVALQQQKNNSGAATSGSGLADDLTSNLLCISSGTVVATNGVSGVGSSGPKTPPEPTASSSNTLPCSSPRLLSSSALVTGALGVLAASAVTTLSGASTPAPTPPGVATLAGSQVKFTLVNTKTALPALRASLLNPLHDPDDEEEEDRREKGREKEHEDGDKDRQQEGGATNASTTSTSGTVAVTTDHLLDLPATLAAGSTTCTVAGSEVLTPAVDPGGSSGARGPNTPPNEPPTSAPSSPDLLHPHRCPHNHHGTLVDNDDDDTDDDIDKDVYDPFDPTKSRSPSPEPSQANESTVLLPLAADGVTAGPTGIDVAAGGVGSALDQLDRESHTPPLVTASGATVVADIQPADSQTPATTTAAATAATLSTITGVATSTSSTAPGHRHHHHHHHHHKTSTATSSTSGPHKIMAIIDLTPEDLDDDGGGGAARLPGRSSGASGHSVGPPLMTPAGKKMAAMAAAQAQQQQVAQQQQAAAAAATSITSVLNQIVQVASSMFPPSTAAAQSKPTSSAPSSSTVSGALGLSSSVTSSSALSTSLAINSSVASSIANSSSTSILSANTAGYTTMPPCTSTNVPSAITSSNAQQSALQSNKINVLNSTIFTAALAAAAATAAPSTATSSTNNAATNSLLSTVISNAVAAANANANNNSPAKNPKGLLNKATIGGVSVAKPSPLSKKSTTNVFGLGGGEIDLESPYSPGSSDYEDLFDPPTDLPTNRTKSSKKSSKTAANLSSTAPSTGAQSVFDNLFGNPSPSNKFTSASKVQNKKGGAIKKSAFGKTKMVGVKIDEDSLKVMDEVPNSAVEMQVKDKFLKKLNRQERVVEEVKLVLKPHYNKKHITKEEYKDVLRRAVPKICHNKSGEINPKKIQNLIEAYVKKLRQSKKVTSSSSKM